MTECNEEQKNWETLQNLLRQKRTERNEKKEHWETLQRLLKLCPIENLFLYKEDILSIIRGNAILPSWNITLQTDSDTILFREDVFKSLIQRRDWGANANQEFIARFIYSTKADIGKLFHNKKDWKELNLQQNQNLNLLLGTGMGIDLFRCSGFLKQFYSSEAGSKGKAFWEILEEKAEEAFKRCKTPDVSLILKKLIGLLFQDKDKQILEEWHCSWINIKKRAENLNERSILVTCLEKQAKSRRLDWFKNNVLDKWNINIFMSAKCWMDSSCSLSCRYRKRLRQLRKKITSLAKDYPANASDLLKAVEELNSIAKNTAALVNRTEDMITSMRMAADSRERLEQLLNLTSPNKKSLIRDHIEKLEQELKRKKDDDAREGADILKNMIPYLFGISPGSMKHMYNQFNAVSDDPYQIDGLFQKTETGAKLRLTDEAADYIVEHLDQEKKISIKKSFYKLMGEVSNLLGQYIEEENIGRHK